MSGAGRFEVVVGVEVHAQLATRTKLFCGCRTDFGAPANTQTCPVCLGLPGALPVLNREAFILCARTARALGCAVPDVTSFDRKNYYYPDQPKNYQISQHREPLGTEGRLVLLRSGKAIRIDNVHLEEDAGKLLHDEAGGDRSVVDLNRSGVPLAEIVSGPDLRSLDEVQDYMDTLRLTLLHLGASRCRMQEGNLRFEASISLREPGAGALGTRVEIKNLNSTKAVIAALEHEALRQSAALEAGEAIEQETRLFDEASGETRRMRSKEHAEDYRYFPEPDLPPVRVTAELLAEVDQGLVELPIERIARYKGELGLRDYDADVLVQDPALSAYFDALVAELEGDARTAANWIMNDVLSVAKAQGVEPAGFPVTPAALAALVRMTAADEVSGQAARTQVLPRMVETGREAKDVVEALGLRQESDASALAAIVEGVLDEHPGPVAQYLEGKVQTLGFLVGQGMKATKGKGNPKMLKDLLTAALEARRP